MCHLMNANGEANCPVIRILRSTRCDYESYVQLYRENGSSFTYEQFTTCYNEVHNRAESGVWILERNNQIIGTATLIVETKFIHNISRVAHIEDVLISKDYRHLGCGKRLIEHLIEKADSLGCYKVVCVCRDEVIPFYKKCGMSVRGAFMCKLLKEQPNYTTDIHDALVRKSQV